MQVEGIPEDKQDQAGRPPELVAMPKRVFRSVLGSIISYD
jgi:hypothetical protein